MQGSGSSISTASDDDADGTSDADTAVIGDVETSSSALEVVAGTEDKVGLLRFLSLCVGKSGGGGRGGGRRYVSRAVAVRPFTKWGGGAGDVGTNLDIGVGQRFSALMGGGTCQDALVPKSRSCVVHKLTFDPSWPPMFSPFCTAPNDNNHQPEAVYGNNSSNLGMVTELVAFTLPLLVVW